MIRNPTTSYANIYRVLKILGSASLATTLLSLLRNKALAVFLGPTGYGAIALLNALVSTSGNLGGLGIGYSATRIISRARGRLRYSFAEFAERALTTLGYKLATATILASFIIVAVGAFNAHDKGIGIPSMIATAIAAGFSILASVNVTRMQIRRMPGRLAAATVGGAMLFTIVCVPSAAVAGMAAIPVIVAALPLSLWLATFLALRQIPPFAATLSQQRRSELVQRVIARKGIPLMLPGVLDSGGTFVVRAAGVAILGLATIGHVYAASALASFILATMMTAMNQDFLPRLCESVDQRDKLRSLSVEQLLVTLQMSAPVLLVVCAFSNEVTSALYSPEFSEAAQLVPLMSVLVVMNIANWPVHTIQTALGLPRQQLAGAAANTGAAVATIAVLHQSLDAMTFSMALVVGAIAQFATQAILLWRSEKLGYSAREWMAIALVLVSIILVAASGYLYAAREIVGLSIAVVWAAFVLRHYVVHHSDNERTAARR